MMLDVVVYVSGGASTARRFWEEQKPGGKLHGLINTKAVISDHPERGGLDNLIAAGFPKEHAHATDPNTKFADQQLEFHEHYDPDFFCQFGLERKTQPQVLRLKRGVNQHVGPGGQYMIGVRRIWVHLRFCEEVWQKLPIPIFLQFVHPEYDKGDVFYLRWEDPWEYGDTPEEIAHGLLPVEHEVVVEGMRRLATKEYKVQPVPSIARSGEIDLLQRLILQSKEVYSTLH